ncbi:MAG: right-handed parallel beta-helix repeat-containing protein, partial [Lentisphaerae bacterium]|nr:right-handed parallel beta-helix repeat-containing protein [Lentisphaerota bacterium]
MQYITLDIRHDTQDQTLLHEPCASLEAAVSRARQYAPETRRTIRLGAGRHVLEHTLVLDPRDAGLTIEAAAGEKPVLYGGIVLPGWEPDGDRFWSAPAPGTADGVRNFRQLYVNGEARPRARLPETGTWPHASVFDQPCLATCEAPAGGIFQPPPSAETRATLIYREGQLPADFETQNAECVVLHSWDESQARVSAHDPATRTLRLDPPCGYPPGAFGIREYYVLNLREGMTRPGQWYLDRVRGRVVYWPLPGEVPHGCAIEVPTLHTMLRIEGRPDAPVANLTLRGLTVDLCGVRLAPSGWGAATFDGAVMLQHARQCRLEHLTVRRAGGQGIKICDADDTTVQSCDVAHTGANGIFFHRGARNAILDCRVQDAGGIYPSACGINAGHWTHSRIARNEVSDCAYCGITLGNGMQEQTPSENVVEANHVWNVMTDSNDGGCLYFYGIERGTVVRGNRLHGARGRKDGRAMGLYLDEHVEDIVCEDNLVYDIGYRPLSLHIAKRIIVRHNIFVCGPGRKIAMARSRDGV